jgi:hypothetical protein
VPRPRLGAGQLRLVRGLLRSGWRLLVPGVAALAVVLLAASAAEANPTNQNRPTVTGAFSVGQTLTASTGDWTANNPTFAYQWQRCAPSPSTVGADAPAG